MRIGVDACCWSNRRGFGRFTRELLTALIRIDAANDYVFFVDAATASRYAFPDGVDVVPVATAVSPTEAASGTGRRSLRDVWAMSRAVMKRRLDLFFFPAVYSYFPILNRRPKIIVTIHDVIAATHPELVFGDRRTARFWRWKETIARKQADLILTVSDYSRRTISERFGLPASRVEAISEAASADFMPLEANAETNVVLERHGLAPADRFLLYVGAITPYKNLPALIDAYAILARRPELANLRLVMVGDFKDDPSFFNCHAALQNRIDALGLTDRIAFPGFVPDHDLVHLYNAASAFVLPSVEEGFGITALEALQCGTPVAASRRGSLPEVIGEAGLFFEPDDAEDMASVIEAILGDERVGQEMRRKGLARAKEFSWDAAARTTLKIFDAVRP